MSHRFRHYTNRILSQENTFFKTKKAANLSAVLIYPNHYEIGISNLGFQTVYRLLNQNQNIYAERAFTYPEPFQAISATLESNRSIAEFDLIAFSIAYELDYINMVRMLNNATIPNRDENHPLIVAGGMVMFMNPMPVTSFLDVIFIGEAEGLLDPFLEILEKARDDHWSRKKLLEELAKVEGLFVPAVHDHRYPDIIKRHYRPKEDKNLNLSAVTTPLGILKDMYLIEVGRGCPRNCRFCAAGYVYRPYRIHRLDQIKKHINPTSFRNQPVGLVGSAISDYPELSDLMQFVIENKGRLGISSFRIDEINQSNIELFERGGLKSVSVAPEAGSERMRCIINKNISENEILDASQLVARSRLKTLKLYFMIGLPFEESRDLEAMVELGGKINEIYFQENSKGRVKISCNVFVPKAFTPFQWSAMDTEKVVESKRNYLKNAFKSYHKIYFNATKSTREDILQGILSLGDESVSPLIENLARNGGNWKNAAREIDFRFDNIVFKEKIHTQPLPWDFIKGALSKEYLWREYMRAREIALE
jgi:radical SAM superfamily enzyme YgiQ (UPF0313 family)